MMFALRHVYPADGDMIQVQAPWWQYMAQHGFGGIATINDDLGADYTSIWYFVIFLCEKIGLYSGGHYLEYSIKGLAMAGTVVAAVATFFIVKTFDKRVDSWRPWIAASLIPFLPAFFFDTLKTNLPDSIYIALDLLVLLAAIRRRPALAWFILGVAVSFKLMAIYVVPFLVVLYLVQFSSMKIISRLAPLFSALGLILMSLPGLIAGQSVFNATVGMMVERGNSQGFMGFGIWPILFSPAWDNVMPQPGPNDKVFEMTLFGLAAILLILGTLAVLVLKVRDRAEQVDSMLDLLVVSPVVFFLFMPSQHETYWALASVFALLVFVLRWSKQSFGLLMVFSLVLIEMFMGGRVIPMIVCEYILLAAVIYLSVRIIRHSAIGRIGAVTPEMMAST